MILLFRKLQYKVYQKWFCRQFINRSKSLHGYSDFLKHLRKRDPLPTSFVTVAIYDVLDNNGMNKLIKRLYRLKHNKGYDVHTHYIKRDFKRLDYISSNINGIHFGRISEIKLKNDPWLSEINISFTYLNSSEAIICYSFVFKKVISTFLQIHNFVVDNLRKARKEWYFHSYADKSIIKKADCRTLFECDDYFFTDILQAYICELFYTIKGKRHKLPVEFNLKIHRNNHKKSKKLRNTFLCECYEKGAEHIVIRSFSHERYEISHYSSGKYFSSPIMLYYFSNFSIEMYYSAFRDIEQLELEQHMRKYLNSRKNFVSPKDLKWLINKIRYIREQTEHILYALQPDKLEYIEHFTGWKLYIAGKKEDRDFINFPEHTKYFRTLFEQYLDYLNSIAAVQNSRIVIIVTVITLVISFAGVIITLLLGLH